MGSAQPCRACTHAGSWYEADGGKLAPQLQDWLAAGSNTQYGHPKAIIGPHAGLRYSGHVAGYAYAPIDASRVDRVILLGPSHHFYTKKSLVSRAASYDTPLGPIAVDRAMCEELVRSHGMDWMPLDVDEAEHSLELHLPFIAQVFKTTDFKLVPIMVGAVNSSTEEAYGHALAPYLQDERTIFIVSSDFCHWGSRFQYQPTDPSTAEPIHKQIEQLDHDGMAAISSLEPSSFRKYLSETQNTICGRHPISVLMHALCAHRRADGTVPYRLEWVRYAQSSSVQTMRDSSVSYASGLVYCE